MENLVSYALSAPILWRMARRILAFLWELDPAKVSSLVQDKSNMRSESYTRVVFRASMFLFAFAHLRLLHLSIITFLRPCKAPAAAGGQLLTFLSRQHAA